jgi:hypothetical protein
LADLPNLEEFVARQEFPDGLLEKIVENNVNQVYSYHFVTFTDFLVWIAKSKPGAAATILEFLCDEDAIFSRLRSERMILFAINLLRDHPDLMERWLPVLLEPRPYFRMDEQVVCAIRDFLGEAAESPDWLLDFMFRIVTDGSEKMEMWAAAVAGKANGEQIDRVVDRLIENVKSDQGALNGLAVIVRICPERREGIVARLPLSPEQYLRRTTRLYRAIAALSGTPT